jgi:hypothetical protein
VFLLLQLRSSCSFLHFIFLDPLSSKTRVPLSFFFLEFFLAQKSSLDRAPRRGEGRVIELLGVWMTQWFRRQSTSFGIYAFIMHWCFTCFASSDDVMCVHYGVWSVYVLSHSHLMQLLQERTSTYGFLLSGILFGTTFFS